jgi:hypothetical protein
VDSWSSRLMGQRRQRICGRYRPLSDPESRATTEDWNLTEEWEAWSSLCSTRKQPDVEQNAHCCEDNEVRYVLPIYRCSESRCSPHTSKHSIMISSAKKELPKMQQRPPADISTYTKWLHRKHDGDDKGAQ